MSLRIVIMLVLGTACSYDPDLSVDAAVDGRPDSGPPVGYVAHVADGDELAFSSAAELTFTQPTTIDTSTGMVSPALPADVHVAMLAQSPTETGAPELMVIQARTIHIDSAITVSGTRALVLVARETVTVQARLDATGAVGRGGP